MVEAVCIGLLKGDSQFPG